MAYDETHKRYKGYDQEPRLTLNGAIFQSAHYLQFLPLTTTGFGWSDAEIDELLERIRQHVKDNPTALDGLSEEIRNTISAALA